MNEAKLIMGIRRKYSKLLSEVPLEVAVQAITVVWQSCQDQSDKEEDFGE